MRRVLFLAFLISCQPVQPNAPMPPRTLLSPPATVAEPPASDGPVECPTSSAADSTAPLTGPPRLVLENPETADFNVDGALVDEQGVLGTMWLWPHHVDCPAYTPERHIVPRCGTYEITAPITPYDVDECRPGQPLPPGRYIVSFSSGYTELYASASLELPLIAPRRVPFARHAGEPFACDELKARRAARLTFTAARALPGFSQGLLAGCDATQARCGRLPTPEAPPPTDCTVTLHEDGTFHRGLLRVHRPAGDDAIREITAWTDRDVVFVDDVTLERTSASRLQIGGKNVVLAGVTARHLHGHGGPAASIGHMTEQVYNSIDRALRCTTGGCIHNC